MVVVGPRSYCGSNAYLSALREGAARIGLDGQPTGVVNTQGEVCRGSIGREDSPSNDPALDLHDADREAHVICNSQHIRARHFGWTSPAFAKRPSRGRETPQGVIALGESPVAI
jgi:hypothetical protein